MIKAVIIDDEQRSRDLLAGIFEKYIPEVEVMATCADVPDGVLAINKFNPDLVFLDIEMPKYSGFQLLEFFQSLTFEIIFVTAYNDYAIKAFEVSALDYILKPVQIDKLEAAVEKFKQKKKASIYDRVENLKTNLKSEKISRIALPVSDGLVFIEVDDISYLEADGAYTKVNLKNGSNLLISKKLRYFEDLLGGREQFYRIHRSHIININYIKKYSRAEGYLTLDNQTSVRVARDKKSDFEAYIADIRV